MNRIEELQQEKDELYAERTRLELRLSEIKVKVDTTPPYERGQQWYRELLEERVKLKGLVNEASRDIQEVKRELYKEEQLPKEKVKEKTPDEIGFRMFFELVAAKVSSGDDRHINEISHEALSDLKAMKKVFNEN